MAKAKTRDVLLLLIAMLLACAAALPAKAAAPTFSVMLPTSLPITIDAAGNVAVADDAAIVNNGDGAVKVDSIAVEPCGAWTLEPWGTTFGIVGEHRFSLRIGGVAAQADGSVDVSGLGSIESGGSLTLSYDAAVPPQADALAQTIANVVFTVSWRDGEPVEEEGDVYAILYTDGELVFQRGDTPEDGRAVTAVYGDIETTTDVPWENQTSKIKSVTFSHASRPRHDKQLVRGMLKNYDPRSHGARHVESDEHGVYVRYLHRLGKRRRFGMGHLPRHDDAPDVQRLLLVEGAGSVLVGYLVFGAGQLYVRRMPCAENLRSFGMGYFQCNEHDPYVRRLPEPDNDLGVRYVRNDGRDGG